MTVISTQLRLSDNVLGDEDMVIANVEIDLVSSMITKKVVIQAGAYGPEAIPGVGTNLDELLLWLSHDSTGYHPEEYHEIKTASGDYRMVFDGCDLERVFEDLDNRQEQEQEMVFEAFVTSLMPERHDERPYTPRDFGLREER